MLKKENGKMKSEKVRCCALVVLAILSPLSLWADQSEIAKWDPNMAQKYAVTDTNGVK